jgi:hypothetical protein
MSATQARTTDIPEAEDGRGVPSDGVRPSGEAVVSDAFVGGDGVEKCMVKVFDRVVRCAAYATLCAPVTKRRLYVDVYCMHIPAGAVTMESNDVGPPVHPAASVP